MKNKNVTFSAPKGRPTMSIDPNLRRVIHLLNCEVVMILKVAELTAESLSMKNKMDLDFRCKQISELSRRDIHQCLRDLISQGNGNPNFELCCTSHHYGLRLVDIDAIRILLFDFEVWLSHNIENVRMVQRGGKQKMFNDFEKSRLIRRKLGTTNKIS